ncbi:MAG: cytochrome c biogenesis protein ResB [Thermodesulfobacteriota bacterium]|nr:cytochrome c biogenesis protein ResB [Thermodesulfobacteriota bacterium]
MKKKQTPAGFFYRLWKYFASINLTIAILLSLAITSIIGTVVPQNGDPAIYRHEYGDSLYSIFSFFDVFDMYHSWWFRLQLLILTTCIVVCSIDRISATWKTIFVKVPRFNISRFRNASEKQEFISDLPVDHLKKVCRSIVERGFGYNMIEDKVNGFCIFAEKGRWTRLGVYAVHLSVILLIFGGLLGSIFGFDGYIKIPEGQTVDRIRLTGSEKAHDLGFGIRCDDFSVRFYDSGAPEEYRSRLSIIEDGKPVLKKDIIVNDPLRYKGINIFQSSYGMLRPKQITFNFESKKTGKVYVEELAFGDEFDLPENLGRFVLRNTVNPYIFHGNNLGKSVVGALISDRNEAVDIVIPFRFKNFDRMRRGDVSISIQDFSRSYYTGLQVTNDPGVPMVYLGFIIMIAGFYITFYMSHQRLCVEVIQDSNKTRVMVAGLASRGNMRMKSKVNKISRRLVELSRVRG